MANTGQAALKTKKEVLKTLKDLNLEDIATNLIKLAKF